MHIKVFSLALLENKINNLEPSSDKKKLNVKPRKFPGSRKVDILSDKGTHT